MITCLPEKWGVPAFAGLNHYHSASTSDSHYHELLTGQIPACLADLPTRTVSRASDYYEETFSAGQKLHGQKLLAKQEFPESLVRPF